MARYRGLVDPPNRDYLPKTTFVGKKKHTSNQKHTQKSTFLGMFFRLRQILVRLEMHTPTLENLHT